MPTFMLMSRLTPDMMKDADRRRTLGREWLKRVHETCPGVRMIAHYAILGPYDFIDIYEAPDIETAHRVSMISRADGATTAESWQALPYDQFLQELERIR